MFEGLSKRLQETFDRLGKGGRITENDLNTVMRDVRMALLEADVALPVVKDFVGRVREAAAGAEVHKALRPAQQVVKIVHDELTTTLGEPGRLNFFSGAKPHVIMLVGLQGSGKTTTAAKLSVHLRREGRQPFLVACDTYRPAAVDQLVTLGKQIGVPVYEEGTSAKPIDIAVRGLAAAKAANAAVCIIDTAGRLQIDDTLMAELEEIKRRTHPVEVLLVADAMTGQEAVNIAQGFNQRVGLTGLILTKIDGDARGGAAISMRAVTSVPIKFLGTGEKIDGFEVFHPDRLVDRILGMGDVMTLIEKAEAEFDEDEAEKLAKKMLQNQFTLQDFLEQLQRIKRMGPIAQVLGMIPGLSKLQIAGQLDQQDLDKRLKRVEAIINSMTAKERANPKVLNASRRKRIAAGSGTQVRDVNEVLNQFQQMQTMMGQLRKGRMPKGMPNLLG
ncbi:MAG: signal recognition particle protein [Chloroflexi bacterium]|jgi:signal recognition particle subunit SRP54|nr:MAG: signal recognition particle protein [Chloroflexi bacterium OLB13]MBC6955996.1 signal recognition particle protein [Chloroflexota bacterium]MBV6435382.1 Signal recognition particle protein [Anaerolineae bacterium]MDL1915667.1 signal recognition particle protein [Anaerolineae bacterium CFX4]OQY79750.1 MAG: signal recognition particle protein [Anaerolineae bacterium UTCFX5]